MIFYNGEVALWQDGDGEMTTANCPRSPRIQHEPHTTYNRISGASKYSFNLLVFYNRT